MNVMASTSELAQRVHSEDCRKSLVASGGQRARMPPSSGLQGDCPTGRFLELQVIFGVIHAGVARPQNAREHVAL